MPKKITIHKDNKIIQNNAIKHLSISSIKILDYLYYHSQKNLNELMNKNTENKVIKHFEINPYKMSISQKTMREWAGLEDYDHYTKIIRNAIRELKQDIELKNYIDENGKAIRWALKSFIKDVTESVSEIDNKTIIYNIEIDSSLTKLILSLKNNFTKIDLKYQKNWKSNNTLRLYQYFKSIQKMEQKQEHDLEWFNEFLAPKTPLKFLSKVLEILNRNVKIINKETDIRVNILSDKKSKKIKFSIKSKKETIKKIGAIAKKI